MLLHLYVFLSTVFLGLQGVAVYRSQIKNLSQEEVVYIAKMQNENIVLGDVAPMWSDAAPIKENISSEIIRTPEEINSSINKQIEDLAVIRDQNWNRVKEVELAEEEMGLEPEMVAEQQEEVVEQPTVAAESEVDDIQIYDYGKAKKEVKVANAVRKDEQPALEIENYINKIKNESAKEKNAVVVANNFEAKTNFSVVGNINQFNKLEVRSAFDDEEALFDKLGKAELTKLISGNETTEIFNVDFPQMMPAQVSVLWKKDQVDNVEVPLIEQARVSEMYDYFNLKGELGLLLVKLKDDIDYYEVENSKEMVFLDEYLEETEEPNASYVLYLGLEPGNRSLKFKIENNSLEQNVHLIQNTITYIDIESEVGQKLNFSLFEELPLSKQPKDLVLLGENLQPASNNAFIEKVGLNHFSYSSAESLRGQKELVQITNGGQDYFIDIKKTNESVTLPSPEYINQVLGTVEETNNTSCVIDIKINKKIEFVQTRLWSEAEQVNGNARTVISREEAVTERYLDKDGIFYSSLSDNTERLFLFSDFNGVVLLKIVFKDGSQDVQQYFCGDKIYHLDKTGD